MENLFSPQYALMWAVVLGLALFLPVRRLIWTLYVRRAQRKAELDEAEVARLKRRAGVSAALICFVFAYVYTSQLFPGG